MLIFGRKENEIIDVGNDITITILRIHGNHVRIGIEAPIDCQVNRREITEHIKEERERQCENLN